MIKQEPSTEKLEDCSKQDTTSLEHIRGVISFEEAWENELEYRAWMKSKSLQSSSSGLLPYSNAKHASISEFPSKSSVEGRNTISTVPLSPIKKKETLAFAPVKQQISPSSEKVIARESHGSRLPLQQARHQQAPAGQLQHYPPLPHHLQYRNPLFQQPPVQKPLLPLPEELQTSVQEYGVEINATDYELPSKSSGEGRNSITLLPSSPIMKKEIVPFTPVKQQISPSLSKATARELHNSHLPPQQARHQQAPTVQRQFYRPSLKEFQYRRPLLQQPSVQKPLLSLPKELRSSEQNLKRWQQLHHRSRLSDELHLQSPPSQRPRLQVQQPSLKETLPLLPGKQVQRDSPKRSLDHLQALPSQLYCHLCDVPCMNLLNYKQHCEGKMHRSKQQEKVMQSSSTPTRPLWCDVCEVPCMNQLNYEQHCEGKKHKTKWEEVCGTDKGLGANKNNLLWCKECNVPCMNEMALAQHYAGKKHILHLIELGLNVVSEESMRAKGV